MFSYIYIGIFFVGLLIMMILLTTKSKKVDRIHWSIVLLLQFTNIGYVELSMAKSIDQALMANTLIYIGGTILPTIFVISLFQSLNLSVPHWIKHLLYTFSAFMLYCVRYGSQNGLFFEEMGIEIKKNTTIITYKPGIMLKVHDLYVILLVVVVIIVLAYAKKNKKKSKRIITKGYLYIITLMFVGYMINMIFEPDFIIIPVVYMISLIIAGACFKLSNLYDVDEVVSSFQENSDLIHGYLLVGEDYTCLGATERAIEMIPELDGIVLRKPNGKKAKQSELANLICEMIESHKVGQSEKKKIKMEDEYYSLELSSCDSKHFERQKRLLFEITDVTTEQKYVEIVENYNTKLEQEVLDQTQQMRELAIKDRATKVLSTYGYVLELDKRIEQGTISMYDAYYMDIVRMGTFNRKYGNKVGDYIIVKYASILSEFVQKDEAIGRLGGNFFVALVKKDRRKDFLDLLGGVRMTVETNEGPETIVVSSIAGVYEITEEDQSHEDIMSNVSMAVSLAKNVRKKPVLIMTSDIMNELQAQRQILEIIPNCLKKREFKPYYQPKVNTKEKKLCGAEALVRWEHDGQIISPFQFIPLLEQNEKICDLDFYMLDYVCQDLKRWIDQGLNPPTISVNFSRKNLGNPILAEAIYNVTQKYGVPTHLIQVEITETIDEYPLSYLKGVVEAIQRYGMSDAIDDFGTGSSSINLIKEITFDVIKIDKSFIDTITEKDCKILELIIAMAKQIGAEIITEGAETKEQVDILTNLGCDIIQGFYFDMPLSVGEFEERIKNAHYGNS